MPSPATEAWILDASPIIALAKISRLDLLTGDWHRLVVPSAVAAEVCAAPQGDPARAAVEAGFGGVPVAVRLEHEVLEWGLGAGESAVLSLARELRGIAIVDDREARIAASALAVRFMGTLGVILRARQDSRIAAAGDVIRGLRGAGFYLDTELVRSALDLVGEHWQD